jgi:phospholipid/cholesterol/gamma-HCH transport system permease protein
VADGVQALAEILRMNVALRTDRQGDRASLTPTGPFDLSHAMAAAQAVETAKTRLSGCVSVAVDLAQLDRIDGAGAVLLARLCDQLDAAGYNPHVVEGRNHEAARLIARYREHRGRRPERQIRKMSLLTRIGAVAAELPGKANEAFNFTGRCAAALPKVVATPGSVDWLSLPMLVQEIGADALLVTSAANLLVGVIIGFLGVSQLERLGAIGYVPGLVVVAHFRELGPLVTAIVVAGRSGAGIASEIATMKVSEEIDALQSLGFDPVRWLVMPRCMALAATLPLLTWIGDLLALVGGLAATTLFTNMTAHAYIMATLNAITSRNFPPGLVKTPFLGLAIGLIACGQGLATHGGAAAVGRRTTAAVVQSIFSVIVISAVFTFFFALIGI